MYILSRKELKKMGLNNIDVMQTILSKVDGRQGSLIIRGLPIEKLAKTEGLESMAVRLWQDFTPEQNTVESMILALGQARKRAFEILPTIIKATSHLSTIEALRLAIASLSDDEKILHHYLVTGAIPVFLAAITRNKQGLSLIAPNENLTQAEDFLRMLNGTDKANKLLAQALDKYLVTVCEHGMNASTFTARVITSTRAGLISAVIGAISALKGPLHGGAPGPVLDMLDNIGTEENIDNWINNELSKGKRLMGFGHRIYQVRDPRADVLKKVVAELRENGNSRLDFAEKVEKQALQILARHKPEKPLHTNVEFYTALVLEAVGLQRELFTSVFAMGRVIGWIAHIFEQEKTGRLIRPESEYIGLMQEQVANKTVA